MPEGRPSEDVAFFLTTVPDNEMMSDDDSSVSYIFFTDDHSSRMASIAIFVHCGILKL